MEKIFIILFNLISCMGVCAQEETISIKSEQDISIPPEQEIQITDSTAATVKETTIAVSDTSVANAKPAGFDMMKAHEKAPESVTIWKGGYTEKRWFHSTMLGVPLLIYGVCMIPADKAISEGLKTSRFYVDDYLQYVPMGTQVVMVLAGVKGTSKNRWHAITADAFAGAMMFGVCEGMKFCINRERPDGDDHSMPSAHTAMAFMGAQALAHEYGHRNIWFAIGGYTVATATGVMRILNQKHYASDVLIGAAIGVLSAEMGYWLSDLIFKDKKVFKGVSHKNIKYLQR